MFAYYLELAVRSLRRSPGLTVLMVLAIGFGVAASMTTYSVFRAVSGDPIPWKSSKLFVPQIDIWGPAVRGNNGEPADALDYTDAMTLMRDHRAARQSALYEVDPTIAVPGRGDDSFGVDGYAVAGEFFPMLDIPFIYGSAWSASDDTQAATVAVISNDLNQQLFGGKNSVGQVVQIGGKDYRVAGVMGAWDPQPRYYDVFGSGGFRSDTPDIFLPLNRAIAAGMQNDGRTNCGTAEPAEKGFVGLQKSSCAWLSFMVELDDTAAVLRYRQYLDAYARDQQAKGRFAWAPNNRLRDLPAFLNFEQVVPTDTKVSLLVALGLLVVCLVNTVGLLLAKFLRRSGEIGVRRALGAPRRAIYAQYLIEAGLIGLFGGLLGLVFTAAGVASVGLVLPVSIAALAKLDVPLLGITLLVSIGASLIAALYPTFRASRVQPAWQLKSN
jgi:putative ABC transport system permease protein